MKQVRSKFLRSGLLLLALAVAGDSVIVGRSGSAAASDELIEWSTGFVTSGPERIYYETAGRGEALVLCHGLGGNHVAWYQQVPVFARSYRVITWDQRGFGRSTNTAGESGPAAAVKDLAALLDHLRIERAHLVGQSMGGWAALGFALAHPERVLSLTLANTVGGIFTPSIERAADAFIQAVFAKPRPETIPLGQHPAIGRSFQQRNTAGAFLYQQLQSLGPAPPTNMPFVLRQTAYPHEAVKKLTIPVLFVVGSEDPIFPPAQIREAASLVSTARVVEIPATGHSPYFEEPEIWNKAVLEFLRSTSSKAGS